MMNVRKAIGAATFVAACFAQSAIAQEPLMYTHEETGIEFASWSQDRIAPEGENPGQPGFAFGIALPADALEKDATEYIGYLRCESTADDGKGWCGFSHGQSGQMTNALLLVAYPWEDEVLTSFRFATTYMMPAPYLGDAKLTQISSKITPTGFELVYRCQNCFSWEQDGIPGEVATSSGFIVGGRAQAKFVPEDGACPNTMTFGFHADGFGQWGAEIEKAASDKYEEWAAMATKVVTGSCGGAPAAPEEPATPEEPSETETPKTEEPETEEPEKEEPVTETPDETGEDEVAEDGACAAVDEDETYDYIIVGAGAGGIPMADRLSEAGHKVLLIEKGPPSTHRWGGEMKPEWLEGEPLTRFDVPGLCNQIWHDATGIVCTDMDQIAGCVLGGGTAVNAGLWWKPHPDDWNYNFPTGWKASDLEAATNRVFTRIPGTTHPSMDGILYQDEGFQVLKAGLLDAGFKFNPDSNTAPSEKDKVFAHTTFMFSGGERSGPLATYLVTASRRENFKLWTNTGVRRVVRSGSRITGVEVECNEGGYSGVIKVPSTGRVILSAGTFGTAKLLFRSGIGPADQLKIVQESEDDSETMIADSDWIDLPVGENLMDHLNTDVVVEHPNVYQYNYTEAWWDPNPTDAAMYLRDRSGILAAAAPNIGPMIWDQIEGSDGITRQLQWTSRMEGSLDFVPNNHSITMSQYLGRGVVSRGRMTISPYLTTMVSTLPYLRDDGDREAVIKGLDNIRNALKDVPGLVFLSPADNITSEQYVDDYVVSVGRRSNHWMGTAKMGSDDGRDGGTAVVDPNNKVYGTDNLFVMDASIFPGMMTGNPSAMIVIAAEHAAQRIMALEVIAAPEEAPEEAPAEPITIDSPPEVEFEFGED